MKKITLAHICLVLSICCFSCKSNNVFIPGEKKVAVTNLYAEYYSLAEDCFTIKNYTKALKYYEYVLNDKTLHDTAYYRMGQCYAYSKKYAEAEEVFSNILKKDPDNISLKSSIAYLTAMKGDLNKASLLYKNLVLDNPDNSELLVNYISVLIAAKDYETAKINFEYLEKKYPSTTQLKSLKDSLEKLGETLEKNDVKPEKN